jgi:hypothetical protein
LVEERPCHAAPISYKLLNLVHTYILLKIVLRCLAATAATSWFKTNDFLPGSHCCCGFFYCAFLLVIPIHGRRVKFKGGRAGGPQINPAKSGMAVSHLYGSFINKFPKKIKILRGDLKINLPCPASFVWPSPQRFLDPHPK